MIDDTIEDLHHKIDRHVSFGAIIVNPLFLSELIWTVKFQIMKHFHNNYNRFKGEL